MTLRALKYTESHEWIRLDGDTAVIGITDHAQQSLGDVTFVEPAFWGLLGLGLLGLGL